jgi:pimeloyl-ACP methyl ester carboxylesterase
MGNSWGLWRCLFVGVNPRGWGKSTQLANEKRKYKDTLLADDVTTVITKLLSPSAPDFAELKGTDKTPRTPEDIIIAGFSLGGYMAARSALDFAKRGKRPLLLLLSSIDRVKKVALRQYKSWGFLKSAVAKFGEWVLGQGFDTATTLQQLCKQRPYGKAFPSVTVSGKGAGEQLSISDTKLNTIATEAGCANTAAETGNDVAHLDQNGQFRSVVFKTAILDGVRGWMANRNSAPWTQFYDEVAPE